MPIQPLPPAFVSRLRELIPAEHWQEVLLSFARPRTVCFRVNLLRASIKQVLHVGAQLGLDIQPIDWFASGFWVPAAQRGLLVGSPLHLRGMIYIQNPTSFLAPLVLAPLAQHQILDMAAAPGGKLLLMVEMTQGRVTIAAVEAVKKRFFNMKANLRAQGVDQVRTFLADSTRLWRKCPQRFDRILLDAPCSSESRFSVLQPKSFQYWSQKKIAQMQRKQTRLLFSAIHCLRPGGELVYSTCSFAPEENEQVVTKILRHFKGVIGLVDFSIPVQNTLQGLSQWASQPFDEQLQLARRVLPNHLMQGGFLCKIKKFA